MGVISLTIVSVVVNVVAGVITHYICKWLDESKKKEENGDQHED